MDGDSPQNIFISHFTEEKELANLFQSLFDLNYGKQVNCFISSYSLELGDDFLEKIKDNFAQCKVVLSLCSPESIKRPWISAEGGASFFVGKLCIPICHSGLDFKDLPPFFDKKQGLKLCDKYGIIGLLNIISKTLDISYEEQGIDEFLINAKAIEEKYTFWNKLVQAFEKISLAVYHTYGGYPAAFIHLICLSKLQRIAFNRNDGFVVEINRIINEMGIDGVITTAFFNFPSASLTNTGFALEFGNKYWELFWVLRSLLQKTELKTIPGVLLNLSEIEVDGVNKTSGLPTKIKVQVYKGKKE